ncbi:MAG: carbohydrate ABC transporter permease [Arachnia sp.]
MKTSTPVRTLQYIAVCGYLLVLAVPLVWLIFTALKTPQEIMQLDVTWFPNEVTFQNFVEAFGTYPLVQATLNSLLVAGGSAIIAVLLSVPAAYWMTRNPGRLSKASMVWVLLSQMFPFILIAVPLFLIIINMGLYNTRLGLMLVYVVWSMPFAIWMMRSYVLSIPIELEEAASIDGCTKFQALRYIVAPLLAPGVVAAAMFAFVQSWNEFFFAKAIIKSGGAEPLSLMLVRFVGSSYLSV